MEALNALDSRKLSPAESMARLEKAVLVADQRLFYWKIARSQCFIALGFLGFGTFGLYLGYVSCFIQILELDSPKRLLIVLQNPSWREFSQLAELDDEEDVLHGNVQTR